MGCYPSNVVPVARILRIFTKHYTDCQKVTKVKLFKPSQINFRINGIRALATEKPSKWYRCKLDIGEILSLEDLTTGHFVLIEEAEAATLHELRSDVCC
jgi:hypothetical protein